MPLRIAQWGCSVVDYFPRGAAGGGFTDPNSLNTVLWLDASDTGTYDQQDGFVTYWNDKSASGYNFSGLGASWGPTGNRGAAIADNVQNSLNGLAFFPGTSDIMGSDDAASTWTFLHNGTEFQIYMVVQTYTGDDGTMFGTGLGATPTFTGFTLREDDVTYTDAIIHQVGNGSSSVISDNQGTVFDNTAQLVYIESDASNGTAASRSQIAIDGGSLNGNNAGTATPSASAPALTLILGADGGGTDVSKIILFELVIVQGAASASDRSDMESYLTTKWAI